MSGMKFVFHIICIIAGASTLDINIIHIGNGELGGHETECVCSFTYKPNDNIKSFTSLVIMAKNITSGVFDQIALFLPPAYATLTTNAGYLHGRVTLNNSMESLGQATISFTYLSCIDEKEYKCKITYLTSAGQLELESKTLRLIVKAGPLKPDVVSLLNTTQLWTEGMNATFKCEGNVGKPPGRYIWKRYRRNKTSFSYHNLTTVATKAPDSCIYNAISIITIEITAEDNQAVMRCNEQSVAPLYTQSQPINVFYKVRKPLITKQPNDAFFIVGSENITLTCNADGNPQSSYIWYKDGIIHALSWGSSLVINGINTSDSGTYVCHAFNSFNSNTYNQYQSVDISIVYDMPVLSTDNVITAITDKEKDITEQLWFWISLVLILLVTTIILAHIFRFLYKKAQTTPTYCDIKATTLENHGYESLTSSQYTSISHVYDDIGISNPIIDVHNQEMYTKENEHSLDNSTTGKLKETNT